MAKKKEKTVIVRHCRDCVHSTPDMKFENLSLKGEPTLLSCPFKEWRMVITTTETCSEYDDGVRVVETEPEVRQTGKWDDW